MKSTAHRAVFKFKEKEMELTEGEASKILKAHSIDIDYRDPRSPQEIAVQFVLTNTVSLSDFLDNSIEIREALWQQA